MYALHHSFGLKYFFKYVEPSLYHYEDCSTAYVTENTLS
jgi:hypothetical protein